ncbi:FecR domain-containing protein [Echinicola marina]|uniref:FecR family protein n=1 Tax=Echinicola marina TaxID=2859768 RepID=UPI001CF67956|nr:FecR domain-containing protein [Echinicola marina]UCS95467.1 FecR domain-containing protein [Echinicola marina]
MNKDKLIRFLNNEASQSERLEVSRWLEQPGAQEKLDALIEESWAETENCDSPENAEQILLGIHQKIKKEGEELPNSKRRDIWWPVTKLAASLLLMALLSVVVYRQINNMDEPEVIEELVVYTKETKSGQKLKLRLPDRTFVVLNANSSLSYTSEFGKEIREVELKGEAFFEIASDEKRPFKVRTGDLVTTALGTAFNAYSREEEIAVALSEGKVMVEQLDLDGEDKEVLLAPGQMASYTPEIDAKIQIEQFEPLKVMAWKEGKIRFKSSRLREVVNDLEKWYCIDIVMEKGVGPNRKVSGLFDNESLDNILRGLSFSLGIKYEIQENKVVLKK